MAKSHLISALVSKRSELRGDIIYYKELARLADEKLAIIDQAIRIFKPNYKFGNTKPVNKHKNRYFSNGEAVLLLDTLRNLNRSANTSEIIISKKGFEFGNDFEKETFQKSIVASLCGTAENDLLERVGLTMIWKITPPHEGCDLIAPPILFVVIYLNNYISILA